MIIKVESEVDITAEELVERLSISDIGKLLTAVAEKLKDDNINRAISASWFGEGLSEEGARFVAEAITSRFVGKK